MSCGEEGLRNLPQLRNSWWLLHCPHHASRRVWCSAQARPLFPANVPQVNPSRLRKHVDPSKLRQVPRHVPPAYREKTPPILTEQSLKSDRPRRFPNSEKFTRTRSDVSVPTSLTFHWVCASIRKRRSSQAEASLPARHLTADAIRKNCGAGRARHALQILHATGWQEPGWLSRLPNFPPGHDP